MQATMTFASIAFAPGPALLWKCMALTQCLKNMHSDALTRLHCAATVKTLPLLLLQNPNSDVPVLAGPPHEDLH